jgi:uncharacterized protein (TIGR03437 family)
LEINDISRFGSSKLLKTRVIAYMMERQRKLIFAKIAVVIGAIPLLLWAHEFGPDAGVCGVPKENGAISTAQSAVPGTCAQSSCHLGTANDPNNKGSVTVNFPNGLTYVPGVKQHVTVTVSDPIASQKAWGFQLTARTAANSNTQAGSFDSTDKFTGVECATANLGTESPLPLLSSSQSCPANMVLWYIEHTLSGYNDSLGKTGSYTYQFDWTPPSSNVGNIVVYVAANAANGDLTTGGDHIYTKTYTLTPAAGGSGPTISSTGVVNGASFQPGIVPGSWLTIQGSNLSPTTDTWDKAIVNGKLPVTLDGVSVNVGSKQAFVYYISPTQINVQAPDVGTGPVPVTVTTPTGTSAAVTATVAQEAPAFFLWPNSQAVATRQDASLAVKNGTFAGATTVAAKPGDVLILWGTGFGPTIPPVSAGIQVPGDKQYNSSPVTISLGTTSPQVFGCALSPGFAGLYQVAIQVPATMADGDYPLKATVSGTSSPDGVILSVKK